MHNRYKTKVNNFCYNSDENSVIAYTLHPVVAVGKLNFSVQLSKANLS